MLYQSNLTDQMQYRYIEYKYELEDRFPICGVGMADDPGPVIPMTKTMGTNHQTKGMVHPRLMGILLVLPPIQGVADVPVVVMLL